MTKNRTQTHRAAFTMIELVIAMGITMIIMFVAAYTVGTSSEVQGRANARLEMLLAGRTGIDLLQEDLAGAQIDARGYVFQVETTPQTSILGFTASPAVSLGQTDEVRLYYFHSDTALIRHEVPADQHVDVPNLTAPQIAADAVMYGVESFEVQAYDSMAPRGQDAWVDDWDSINDTDDDGELNEPDPTAAESVLRQYRRMPIVLRVTVQVTDTAGYVENNDDAEPLEIIRLMPVGPMAPAH